MQWVILTVIASRVPFYNKLRVKIDICLFARNTPFAFTLLWDPKAFLRILIARSKRGRGGGPSFCSLPFLFSSPFLQQFRGFCPAEKGRLGGEEKAGKYVDVWAEENALLACRSSLGQFLLSPSSQEEANGALAPAAASASGPVSGGASTREPADTKSLVRKHPKRKVP